MQDFDKLKEKVIQKTEIWSADKDKEFKKFDKSEHQLKHKVPLKGLDFKHDHYIVQEYKVKPDPFKKLIETNVCKLPMWLVLLASFIGLLLFIGALVAVIIAAAAPDRYFTFGDSCDSNRICDPSKNLLCSNSTCTCSNSFKYWDSSSNNCENKKSYAQSCTSTNQCLESFGLYCSTTANSCNCPLTSVANMCDCISSKYFDDTTKSCVNRLTYGATCTLDKQCDQTKLLICQSGKCGCLSTQYYSGSKCETLKTFGVGCTSTSQCDSSKNLECNSGTNTCLCTSNYYYNGNACVIKKYVGESCSATSNCFNTNLGVTCSTTCDCRSPWDFWSMVSGICLTCRTGSNFFNFNNDACFLYDSTDSKTWSSSTCTSYSRLWEASSYADFNLLQYYFSSNSLIGPVWVGARSNRWTTSGSTVSSSFMCSTGTSSSGNCLAMVYDSSLETYCFKWYSCSNTYTYICEQITN